MERFDELIKGVRAGARLTQAQAADRVGVSERTWQRWEGDDGIPRLDETHAIIAAFGLDEERVFLARFESAMYGMPGPITPEEERRAELRRAAAGQIRPE